MKVIIIVLLLALAGAMFYVRFAPIEISRWHKRADVGAHAGHPQLCGRCVSNVDGPGEVRFDYRPVHEETLTDEVEYVAPKARVY